VDRAVALLVEARRLCDPTADADLIQDIDTLLSELGPGPDPI
jgi:hypothetical protein